MTANVNDSKLSRLDPYPNQPKKPLLCILRLHKWKPVAMEIARKGKKGYTFVAGRQCTRLGCNEQQIAEYNMLDWDYAPTEHVETIDEVKVYLRAEFDKLKKDLAQFGKLQDVIDHWKKELTE